MKRLTLIRHAKSSWGNLSLSDFDRPLNARGEMAAPAMGTALKSRGLAPDRMVSSPALRAITTCKLLAKAFDYAEDGIVIEPSIYEASIAALLGIVRALPDDAEHVILVGHNPGMHGLAVTLSESSIDQFPTCAVADLEAEVDSWAAIRENRLRLREFLCPKMLEV